MGISYTFTYNIMRILASINFPKRIKICSLVICKKNMSGYLCYNTKDILYFDTVFNIILTWTMRTVVKNTRHYLFYNLKNGNERILQNSSMEKIDFSYFQEMINTGTKFNKIGCIQVTYGLHTCTHRNATVIA